MPREVKKRPVTTGHGWDGIEEYNNPDPFWLRLFFYGALFFTLIYWMLYPSWPTPHSNGLLDWSSQKELEENQAEIVAIRAEYQAEFDNASFEEILKNEKLFKFALAGGRSAFENNCAPCHGVSGSGGIGYPNLTTGAWLWGGKLEDIYTTIKYSIRSGHEETRESQMAAFGKDKILTSEQIAALTNCVVSLSSKKPDEDFSAHRLFIENCASCHGVDGGGGREFGAPNLRDAVSLYGSSYESIFDVIYSGRSGVMPYWIGKLSDSTIRQLTICVHQLGGGE
ncbi:MAG: cytochrome-c oxidase, cbb3-type subunit III [Candidatus Midichloria mitochondrii]|nr:cytochrome-c oxidase, cbb3-type subunit III [Candidatus Midichloria mitochondrii]